MLNLCEAVESKIVSNMLLNNNSTNKPINTETLGIDLNNGGFIVISVLIILLVIAVVALSIFISKYKELKEELSEVHKNQELSSNIKTEESQVLTKYRELSEQEKKLINDTLTTLSNKKDN